MAPPQERAPEIVVGNMSIVSRIDQLEKNVSSGLVGSNPETIQAFNQVNARIDTLEAHLGVLVVAVDALLQKIS